MSETVDEDFEASVEFTFTRSDTDEVTIRQPMLGMSPYILIQPEISDDGKSVIFQGIACDFEQDNLADVLEMIADAVRRGHVEVTEVTDDDA